MNMLDLTVVPVSSADLISPTRMSLCPALYAVSVSYVSPTVDLASVMLNRLVNAYAIEDTFYSGNSPFMLVDAFLIAILINSRDSLFNDLTPAGLAIVQSLFQESNVMNANANDPVALVEIAHCINFVIADKVNGLSIEHVRLAINLFKLAKGL